MKTLQKSQSNVKEITFELKEVSYRIVGRRSPPTRASRAGMATPEEESTSTTGKLVTRTSLYCGYTVSTITRAGRTSTTA